MKKKIKNILSALLVVCMAFTSAIAAEATQLSPYLGFQQEYYEDLCDQTFSMLGISSSAGSMTGGSGQQIVSIALSQVGLSDAGEANKYSICGGAPGAAWCASFISWCGVEAGTYDSGITTRNASAAGHWDYYCDNPDKGTNYLWSDVTSGAVTPQAGDLIIYNSATYGGTWAIDPTVARRGMLAHIGMVVDTNNGVVQTVEGNWGNRVSIRDLPISGFPQLPDTSQWIWGFCRPKYPAGSFDGMDGATSFSVDGLRIDTDGSPSAGGSNTWQSSTSYAPAGRSSYDCSTHNVVVGYGLDSCVINPARGYCTKVHQYNAALGNCLAAVQEVDENGAPIGSPIYGVVGDNGHQPGEVSLALAQNMGFSNVSGANGVGTEHHFVITYFENCKLSLDARAAKSINDQINEQASSYLAAAR